MSEVAKFLVEFHATYGVPVRSVPQLPDESERALRRELLREEFHEYLNADCDGDLIEVADGLADVVYVAYGTALQYGIDLDSVLAEVHRSNMSKLGTDGKPVLRADGKVTKGPGYFRPDIAAVLVANAEADA